MNEILTEVVGGTVYDVLRLGSAAFWRAVVGSSQDSWRQVFIEAVDKALVRATRIPTSSNDPASAIHDEQIKAAKRLLQSCRRHGRNVIEAWPIDETAKLPEDEEALWRLMESLLYEAANGNDKAANVQCQTLRPTLFPLFKSELAELLRQEPHREAWRACWTQWLLSTRDELRQLAQSLSEQETSQREQYLSIGRRLDALANVPALIQNLTIAAAMSVETGQNHFQLCEALEEIRSWTQGEFVSAGGRMIPSLSTVSQRREAALVANPCIGREAIWEEWTSLLPQGGLWLITAPSGGGKSTAIAHWIQTLRSAGSSAPSSASICSHFFERHDTHGFWGGLTILGEQLLAVHGLRGELLQSETTRLQVVLRLLLERPHPAGLVVVLDGIDEAHGILDDSDATGATLLRDVLPEQLGEGVTVVISTRSTDGDATVAKVRSILNSPTIRHFALPPLDEDAVAIWLHTITHDYPLPPGGIAAEYWAHRVHEKTGGLPLYLHHLIQQMTDLHAMAPSIADEWERILSGLPRKFKDYVQASIGSVAAHERWRHALRFLALAHGPLTEIDLMRLTERSGAPLQPEDWQEIPRQVRRWLERHELNDTVPVSSSSEPGSQASAVWQFSHEAIAQAFISGPERASIREIFKVYLLDFCKNWHSHLSAYALRHIAEHLLEASEWSAVYELAQNQEFRQAINQVLPDEPDWELKLVHMGLRAALAAEDAGQSAEFLLMYRSHISVLGWLHPLRTLHRNNRERRDNQRVSSIELRRAWRTADLYPSAEAALWHLLLAAHLNVTGNQEAAKETILRLYAQPRLPLLKGWQANFAVFLLGDLLSTMVPLVVKTETVKPAAFVCLLGPSLLDPRHLPELAEALHSSGHPTESLVLLCNLESDERYHALLRFAESIHPKDGQLALFCLQSAYEDILKAEQQDDYWYAWRLKDIARTLTRMGHFSDALSVVNHVKDWPDFVSVYGLVAGGLKKKAQERQLEHKDSTPSPSKDIVRDVEHTLRSWESMAAEWEDGYWKGRLLKELSVAWARFGQPTEAMGLLEQVPEDEHSSSLHEIFEALIETGDLISAQKVVEQSQFSSQQAEDWSQLAKRYVEAGNTEAGCRAYHSARLVLENMSEDDDDGESRGDLLVKVAIGQAEAGFFDEAQHTVHAINGEDWYGDGWEYNVKAFTGIARAHARRGDFQAAFQCIATMPINRSTAIAQVIAHQLRAGKILADESVFHRVEHLCRRSKKMGAYLALEAAKACQKQNQKLDAYEALSRAVGEYEERSKAWQALGQSLVTIAQTLIERDKADVARPLLRRAVKRTLSYSHGPGFFQDFFALQPIADLQIRAQAYEDAKETIQKLNTEHIRKEMLHRLQAALAPEETSEDGPTHIEAEVTNLERSHIWTLDLSTQLQQADDPETCARIWADAASEALRTGDTERGNQYYEYAISTAVRVDNEYDKEALICGILEEQAMAGQPIAAVIAAKEYLSSSSDQSTVLRTACIELRKQNRLAEAEDLLQEISHSLTRAEIETKFAEWQFQTGEIEAAQGSLRQLLRRAQGGEFNDWDGQALELVSVALAKANLLKEAVDAALLMSKNADREECWPKITEALINSGDRTHWKELFVRSVDLDVAPWSLCGQLALAYPEQAEAVGQIVSRHTPGHST